MLVRAKETCFIDGSRRRAGVVFEYGGETLPPCLVPAKPEDEPVTPEPQKPVALSQVTDGKPKSFVEVVNRKR